MGYAESKTIAVEEIPVIDFGGFLKGTPEESMQVAQEIRKAAEEVGFFYIRNHGIPESVITQAHRASQSFFSQSQDSKQKIKINSSHHGFLSVGEAKMESAENIDLKESFVWGLDLPDDHPSVNSENPFLGRNQWPRELPQFRDSVYPFFTEGIECGKKVMRAFAMSMGIDPQAFVRQMKEPIARSSIIYYPPQSRELGRSQFGVAPHTDYGCLTLLWQDQVGGLEVQNHQGEWVTAHPIEGTLVVNVGDLLMRWSNDVFRSTPHRVINRQSCERYSMVVAWDPDFDTLIDPSIVCADQESALYPPIRCGEYVLSRFDASFSYRN